MTDRFERPMRADTEVVEPVREPIAPTLPRKRTKEERARALEAVNAIRARVFHKGPLSDRGRA